MDLAGEKLHMHHGGDSATLAVEVPLITAAMQSHAGLQDVMREALELSLCTPPGVEASEALPLRIETLDNRRFVLVQCDLAGFTKMSEQLMDESHDAISGAHKVANIGIMIAELMKLPDMLNLRGRALILEGDMARFVFNSADEALDFCLTAQAYLKKQFSDNKFDELSVRFGMAEIDPANPVLLYVDKNTGEIVSVSGGINKVKDVESLTKNGKIGLTAKVRRRLQDRSDVRFGRHPDDVYCSVSVRDRRKFDRKVSRITTRLENSMPISFGSLREMPIAYTRMYIPKDIDINYALFQMKKLAVDSGLDFVKFNTIQDANFGTSYITFVTKVPTGNEPSTEMIHAFERFSNVCEMVGYHGVTALGYGAVWTGKFEDGQTKRDDVISPILNILARITQSPHYERVFSVWLHESMAQGVETEQNFLRNLIPLDPIKAKGVPHGIRAFWYIPGTGAVQKGIASVGHEIWTLYGKVLGQAFRTVPAYVRAALIQRSGFRRQTV